MSDSEASRSEDSMPGPGVARRVLRRTQRLLERARMRRIYVVDYPMQIRILGQFVMVLLVGILLGLCNAYVVVTLYEAQSVARSLASTPSLAGSTAAWLYAAGSIAANAGLVVLLCVYYSHRVAGPANKIAYVLARMADGRLGTSMRLRDTDLLAELAEEANRVGERWSGDLRSLKEAVASLRRAPDLGTEARARLAAVENVLAGYREEASVM